MEIWKPIPSLPEYEASSLGNVRRVPWLSPMPRGRGYRVYGGYAWPGTNSKHDRRPRITFRGKTYKVADLVCEAFHGKPPFPWTIVVYRDGNLRNCAASNLLWYYSIIAARAG